MEAYGGSFDWRSHGGALAWATGPNDFRKTIGSLSVRPPDSPALLEQPLDEARDVGRPRPMERYLSRALRQMPSPSAMTVRTTDNAVSPAAHLFHHPAACNATLKGSAGEVSPMAAPGERGIGTREDFIQKNAAVRPTNAAAILHRVAPSLAFSHSHILSAPRAVWGAP